MHNFHNLYLAALPYVIWTGGTEDSTVMYRIVLTEYDDRSSAGMSLAFESSRVDVDVDAMHVRRWTTATTAQIAEMLTEAYRELLFDDISQGIDGYR